MLFRSDDKSPWVKLEEEFSAKASASGTPAYILRCAPIVGTGMTGSVRRLAESIYRGVFFHFPGNEARKSIVHATDVARAARFIADNTLAPRIYNLTDGADPTLHDDQNTVYDAFSSFISQKCNELQKLQKTIGLTSHDLFDAIHQMMQGQVSTWTEAQVEEKLSELCIEYRVVAILNDALTVKRKSIKLLSDDIANMFDQIGRAHV